MENPSDSILAVANKIHERALQLASERGARDVAQAELESVRTILEEETKRFHKVRRRLLSSIRTRNGIELEVYKIRDKHRENIETAIRLEKETKELEQQSHDLDRQWRETVSELCAPHQAKRDIYQRILESRLAKHQRTTERRKRKLDFLHNEANHCIEQRKSASTEIEELAALTTAMEDREENEDEEIASLSMQINAMISKVRSNFSVALVSTANNKPLFTLAMQRASLRRAVEEAKENNDTANEDMTMWEQRCVQ